MGVFRFIVEIQKIGKVVKMYQMVRVRQVEILIDVVGCSVGDSDILVFLLGIVGLCLLEWLDQQDYDVDYGQYGVG